jgi:hypothetical protein
MVISEDVSDEDDAVSTKEVLPQANDPMFPSDPPKVEPMILLSALTRFSTPQTIMLIGYIKHHKFMILVDSGNPHNFIQRFLV